MNNNSIKVNNISFAYGKNQVLSNISLQIKKGEFIVLLGPNGSGKSTLIKCTSGLLKKYKNQIIILNKNMKSLTIKEKSNYIGYVPQSYEMNLSISVFEMIAMGLGKGNFSSKEKYLEQVSNIIEKMDLSSIANSNVNQLSGGQLQKVTIARALVKNPQFIMMDEPTSGLDIKNQREVMYYMRDLARNETIGSFCIMHDINLASETADKIVMLKKGKIIAQGTPEEVVTSENIKKTFNVNSNIIEHLGRPHALML